MTFATEFFDVQKALGFKDKSAISSAPFKIYDEKYKSEGRLQDVEKDVDGFGVVRAIFVDGRMVVCKINGEDVEADEVEVREVLGL